MTLPAETLRSLRFRAVNNLPTPPALKLAAFKAIDSLVPINAEYHDAITAALLDFFESKRGTVAAPKGRFKVSVSNAFNDAFDMGWALGGGEFPVDKDAANWIGAQMTAEFGHVDALFEQAKALKTEDGFDVFPWVSARADAYTSALQAVFNAGKLFALKGGLLTWRLGNTEKHCPTCAKLDGQRHRASWYIARDYIPRKPGAGMACGGYNCDCGLENKDGEQVTL